MRAGYRVGQFARGLVTGSVLSLSCCAVSVWYGGLTQASRPERRPRDEGGGQLGDLTASPLLSSDKSFEDVNQLQNTRSILKYGVPDRGPVVRSYIGHSLGYDQARKIPVWVAEHLTPESVKGSAHRKHSKFKADPNVPPQFSASNKDFLQSGGWSRGHMAPAGDFKHNQASMDSTFYLTNVVPQNYENNAGFWNRFEMYCRDLTNRFTDVRIFTGPLFLPNVEKDGKLFVQYQVIGEGLVAVPTHLYKLVLAENNRTNEKALGAFIVPNEPIGFDHSLKEYKVPLESLETKTGVTFLPLIDKTEVSDLCKLDSCELLNKQKFDLYVMGRRMANATTKEKVEKVWGELKSKGLEPDAYITELYDSKLKEMDSKEKKKSEL